MESREVQLASAPDIRTRFESDLVIEWALIKALLALIPPLGRATGNHSILKIAILKQCESINLKREPMMASLKSLKAKGILAQAVLPEMSKEIYIAAADVRALAKKFVEDGDEDEDSLPVTNSSVDDVWVVLQMKKFREDTLKKAFFEPW